MTAQLILMEPERHAWAQSYDCDMSAILTTQREAAKVLGVTPRTVLRRVNRGEIATVASGGRPARAESQGTPLSWWFEIMSA